MALLLSIATEAILLELSGFFEDAFFGGCQGMKAVIVHLFEYPVNLDPKPAF